MAARSSSSSSQPSIINNDEEETFTLYPETLKAKLGKMLVTCHKNHERPEGRGYIVDKILCGGAVNRLSDCFYGANFNPPKKRRGKCMSSREWGIKFHRQIFHRYKCFSESKNSCLCEQKFHVKTKAARKDTKMHQQLEAFEKFLDKNKWKVYDCELVVGWSEIKCATSLDVVCVDDLCNPHEFYVIELKTGYTQRYQARTIDSSGMMKGACGKEIKNSYANHHQLQLWFGVECLKRTYNIDTAAAVVLYIKEDGKYKADYAADWWFKDLKMKKKLGDQLCGKISTFSLY